MLCYRNTRLCPKILHKLCMGHFSNNNAQACKAHTTLISRVRMMLIEYVGIVVSVVGSTVEESHADI